MQVRRFSPRRNRAGLAGLAALVAACGALAAATLSGAAPSPAPGPAHPGQFVWFDLLTHRPGAVEPFYAALFGWTFEAQAGRDNPYKVIRAGGQPIGGIVDVSARKADVPEPVWLSYVSVPDVDKAAADVRQRNGKVLKEPLDLGRAARAAVVTDPAGALLGLARIAKGDPPEAVATAPGRFLWVEYVAEDAESALGFYRETFGYAAERLEGTAVPYWVLRTAGVSRAGLFQRPWSGVRSNWLPYVLVADAAAAAQKARSLGGKVLLEPRADVRSGTLALVTDPSGAALALQQWPIPGAAK